MIRADAALRMLFVGMVLAVVAGAFPYPGVAVAQSATIWPTTGWSESTPESVGVDSEPLDRLASDARAGKFRDLHSLLVVKNGRIIFEEYLPGGSRDQIHTMQSVSKSVTATLVGVALEDGSIASTDTPLLDFFPQYEDLVPVDDRKRSITLEHVLRMRLGMEWLEQRAPYEAPENSLRQLNNHDGDWYEFVLGTPMAEDPGESFLYNSGGAILLAGVLERATGARADQFARERLFDPLGIGPTSWTVVNGVTHTGGGLAMSARDMAKIGYLYLHDGEWDGKRILPEGWVDRATTGRIQPAAPNFMPIGYGYMWWLLPGYEDMESVEAQASIYAAWGHMGQFIFVAPEHDLVFVTTGGAIDQADETVPFDLLYDYVLPAADSSIAFVPPSPAETTMAPEELTSAQTPTVSTFEVTFGGANADRGISVAAMPDGGAVVTGTTTSSGAGEEDVYLVRTGADGALVFERTMGGPGTDCGWSVHPIGDEGFVIGGFTDSYGAGGLDAYLIRTDADGDTLWTRTYGGAADDQAWSVFPLEDGGFILAGQTASEGAGDLDFWLMRTDADGELQWSRTFGGPGIDRAFSVEPTADGGFVLAGITYSFGAGGRDGWVVKTDGAGNETWARTLGSEGYDVAHSVCATPDGGCVVVGYSGGLSVHGGHDAYIVKLDAEGSTEWTNVFGGPRDDRMIGGQRTADGGCVLTGFTVSTQGTGLDVYLAKLDSLGALEWTRTLGGRSEDSGYSVVMTPDGGFFVTGRTKSAGAGESDLYLIKTDGTGAH